jgi:hypothetical protein
MDRQVLGVQRAGNLDRFSFVLARLIQIVQLIVRFVGFVTEDIQVPLLHYRTRKSFRSLPRRTLRILGCLHRHPAGASTGWCKAEANHKSDRDEEYLLHLTPLRWNVAGKSLLARRLPETSIGSCLEIQDLDCACPLDQVRLSPTLKNCHSSDCRKRRFLDLEIAMGTGRNIWVREISGLPGLHESPASSRTGFELALYRPYGQRGRVLQWYVFLVEAGIS